MEKVKRKYIILSIVLIIFIYMAAIAYGYYRLEFSKKPVVKDKLQAGDVNYLYNFYFLAHPNLENRYFYGSADAPIILILYSDIRLDSSKWFMQNIFPQLKIDYIDNGTLKFYHKYYVTSQDMSENATNFMYALMLECMNESSYYDYYFELFNGGDYTEIAKKYNPDINRCLSTQKLNKVKEDMSEVENFGMVGTSPWIYVGIAKDLTIMQGVPSYDRLKRTIRNYQVELGD